MTDTASMAATLYGSAPAAAAPSNDAAPPATATPPADTPSAATIETPGEVPPNAAERLYGEPAATEDAIEIELTPELVAHGMPPEIAADRAQRDPAALAELAQALPDAEFIDEASGIDAELAPIVATELRALAADAGMTAQDVQLVREAYAQRAQTEAEQIADGEQAIAELNRIYGQGAAQAWRDTKRFVAADPRRAQLLAPIGFDPTVVVKITALAQAAKAAGKYPFNIK